ncbi:hypothetical protein K431DRAFT_276368 [Polychaeton citri CBS 116435]|uniref:VHS domain-containing protein n=1 Tax=Polychaeton citri CBS 116435 TaxID=1314669 RepID=A0A9P4Q3D8_9PEZI|nr:hypothetical protein K431DRAFT_276368 [Polychaeton citri CBS 116435]
MFREKKPYSAVTVHIDRMTSEQYEEDDLSGIVDLIEVIKIQASGPTEAARALRKKLKYGNSHRQIRALAIIDGLIQNAGARFQRTFADEPLLERLRLLPRDEVVDPVVRKKCQVLFTQWANAYKNTPGLESIAQLYRQLPKSQRPQEARQKVLQETELESDTEEGGSPTTSRTQSAVNSVPKVAAPAPSSSTLPTRTSQPVTLTPTSSSMYSSKLSKKKDKTKRFNIAKEKENMTTCIAQSSIASTNLLNGLQLVNRENERVSENPEVMRRFDACKRLRRQILVYIQHVESDDWIGSLVNANDELVKALTAYEIMDKSLSDDSDSDAWEQPPAPTMTDAAATQQLSGLKLNDAAAAPAKPPRPNSIPMPPPPPPPQVPAVREPSPASEDEDDDNPFGDSNAVATPGYERPGMTWREV